MPGAHRSTASRRSWAACLVPVLLLHGVALAWMVRGEQSQGAAQLKGGPSVSVRLLSSGPAMAAEPASVVPPVAETLPPSGEPALRASAWPNAAGGPADTAPAAAPDSDSTVDLDGYVPRRWLTVAPRPTAPVLLPFPSAFQDRARYKAVLNLFIEDDGRVGRVEFVGIALPEVLERAARNTFEHARFTPGQVKGRIVKSLIQIEVDFDALGTS